MKAILEFNLDEPEDRSDHLRAVKSLNIVSVIWEFDMYLRSQLKYNDENLTNEAYEALDKAREKLYEIMSSQHVSMDELYN
jgi:CRISPR/Cas system CSM-associated protein Csm5 (group 7 of RAMP superfamily)